MFPVSFGFKAHVLESTLGVEWKEDPYLKAGLSKGSTFRQRQTNNNVPTGTEIKAVPSPTFWVRKNVSPEGALTNILPVSYKFTFEYLDCGSRWTGA